jgi:hypothetical protein
MPTSNVRSGNALPKMSRPVPEGMAAVIATILSSWRASSDQRLAEDARVGRRVALGLGLRAGDDVELGDAVILVVRGLGRGVALALLRHDMDQHRPADVGVAHVLQHRQQMVEIMPVDRADVVEAQLLEQRAARDIAAGVLLDRARNGAVEALGQALRQLLAESRSLR